MLPILLQLQERLSSTHQTHIIYDDNNNSSINKDENNDKMKDNWGKNDEQLRCSNTKSVTENESLIVYNIANYCKDEYTINANNNNNYKKNDDNDDIMNDNIQ